jgi:hypothetical protein
MRYLADGGVPQNVGRAMETLMDFLVERFTVLGVEFQYWMPVVLSAVALYLFYMWKTGQLH